MLGLFPPSALAMLYGNSPCRRDEHDVLATSSVKLCYQPLLWQKQKHSNSTHIANIRASTVYVSLVHIRGVDGMKKGRTKSHVLEYWVVTSCDRGSAIRV